MANIGLFWLFLERLICLGENPAVSLAKAMCASRGKEDEQMKAAALPKSWETGLCANP